MDARTQHTQCCTCRSFAAFISFLVGCWKGDFFLKARQPYFERLKFGTVSKFGFDSRMLHTQCCMCHPFAAFIVFLVGRWKVKFMRTRKPYFESLRLGTVCKFGTDAVRSIHLAASVGRSLARYIRVLLCWLF